MFLAKKLKNYLEEQNRAQIISFVKEMRQNGCAIHQIQDIIDNYREMNEISDCFDDFLDDICSALEGWCSTEYVLHPSQFKKEGE